MTRTEAIRRASMRLKCTREEVLQKIRAERPEGRNEFLWELEWLAQLLDLHEPWEAEAIAPKAQRIKAKRPAPSQTVATPAPPKYLTTKAGQ
ncbi:MAG: hypothetical protein QOE79_200 [Sphingomonadales bacterium]|nr:hypothetical protein [Sphingomonadales bacterium]